MEFRDSSSAMSTTGPDRETPARRICRRSVRVAGTGVDWVVATVLKCSDIGLGEPLRETRSGLRSLPPFSPQGWRPPMGPGYRVEGTKGQGCGNDRTSLR